MVTLKLPDGSVKQVPPGTRPREVAESIGKRLAQAAVAAKVNGTIVDLDRELPAGNTELTFQILTEKDREALDVLRHSCAHVRARAWMRVFLGGPLHLGGAAFFSQKELDAYLKQAEEAKKRDHRVLGKQLRLFTISPLVGSGLILWMPKGAIVRGLLESFIKDELVKRGYQPVYTPHIGRLELYRTSGHFPFYRDAQFPPLFFHPLGQAVDWWLTQFESNQLSDQA